MAAQTHPSKRAVGYFTSRPQAEAALGQLKDTGFAMDQVSIVAQKQAGLVDIDADKSPKEQAQGGASLGATSGSVTGGAIGLAGSLGILAIPGIGPLAEAGVLLASSLLGGGIGAASGGLIGALVGWGIPEDQAAFYNNRLFDHKDYLILVEGSEDDVQAAEEIVTPLGVQAWSLYGAPATPLDTYGTGTLRPY
ncbi:hypothetical protein C7271_03495 [filamentous cyanobacterium CCP5]|nr:hypothetical protein C7271_03495 [filamentous cyanobacterium CCP5]